MSVPVGRRKQSRFEAQHHYLRLRSEITELMLLDFGFSVEKYNDMIERYRQSHSNSGDTEEIVERYRRKCEAFHRWFIDKECDAILEILRNIQCEFTMGNSIYPGETPAKIAEFCQRRRHVNEAIAGCYALKQELQYVIMVLPVDMNKFERFAEAIDKQISLYKGVRQSDNRLLKPRPVKKKKDKE